MFAKLFESEVHGQILVKIDSNDEGPEVRYYFEPENLGVCTMAVNFPDTDDGWDRAEKLFKQITLQQSEGVVSGIKKELSI